MISRNMVAAMATIVIGAVYLNFAYQLRVSSLADAFGPQGLPRVYGWLTLGLGVVLLVQSVLAVRALDAEERVAFFREEWAGQGRRILRAAGFLLIATAYLLLLPYLGYLLSLALLIAGITLYMGAAPSWRTVVVPLVGAVLLWLIFVKLPGVDMPAASVLSRLS
ncbi:tripartite tricarboxylate transporter TctB family protein (plasmid) [Paracoccus yeei]|uniref:tripartite tricarboxylate transporter TctB family protein n=1 Tax=Paracoccus yeei TaxID=147645 RepID=UPI003BF7D65B